MQREDHDFIESNDSVDVRSGRQVDFGEVSVTIVEKVAEGGFAVIYSAVDSKQKKYAIKFSASSSEENLNAFIREYQIQKLLSAASKHVVKVYNMIVNRNEMTSLILMDFCESTLVKFLNTSFSRSLPCETILKVFIPVCEAIDCMHDQNPPLIHRDIKVENVLLHNDKWKLCDFGSTTDIVFKNTNEAEKEEAKQNIDRFTTTIYRPPEAVDLFRHQEIGTKFDIWSIGCLLFKICTFKDAFNENEPLGILNGKVTWPIAPAVDMRMKQLVKYCLNADPIQRPTIKQVLNKSYSLFPDIVDQKYKPDVENDTQGSTPQSFDVFAQNTTADSQLNLENIIIKRNLVEHFDSFEDFDFDDENNEEPDPFTPVVKGSNLTRKVSFDSDSFGQHFNNSMSSRNAKKINDPFAPQSNPAIINDPFAPQSNPAIINDPFAPQSNQAIINDPFAPQSNPAIINDPFAPQSNPTIINDPFATPFDPFAIHNKSAVPANDQFFVENDPFNPVFDPFIQSANKNSISKPPAHLAEMGEELNPEIDISLLERNQKELERQLLSMDEFDMSTAMNTLFRSAPNATSLFIFTILPRSGSKAICLFRNIDESLCDPEIGGVLCLLKSIFEQSPHLRGDFTSDHMETISAQPLLTLADVVCSISRERYIEELATIAAGSYNGALGIYRSTNNKNLGERLEIAYSNVSDVLELLHSPLLIDLP